MSDIKHEMTLGEFLDGCANGKIAIPNKPDNDFYDIDNIVSCVCETGNFDFSYQGVGYGLTHTVSNKHPWFVRYYILRDGSTEEEDMQIPVFSTIVEALQAKLFDGKSIEDLIGNSDFSVNP